ncbi:sensor histidine kinase [Nocardia alba]|uniref:histidine kinase n=1 Tax=Nocardia alba TaxID=225051 RepID=A0A4R1FY29_9NOCA|nr:ATP-binding protein [Nocardia alba]TCK00024.1 signal transduction histidine kinase [Nocardia alba]
MEPASRSWQFSLSNWSVTRKVGVVLVLPVMLATTFAVLRINNELQTMTQLGAASEQATVIRPVIKFATATEQLAVAATANWGAIADPQTDAALTTYDQALAEVQSALRSARIDSGVASELTAATTTGATLRNTVRGGSPAMVGEQTDEIGERIGNALAKTPQVEDFVVQRYFLQLTALHQARRVLTRERTLVVSPESGRSQSARAKMLVELGSELNMIKTYGIILPEHAVSQAALIDAVQTRISVFSQNNGDPTTNAAVLNTLQVSADTYSSTISALLDNIDRTLDSNTATAQTGALRETTLVLGMLLGGLALALAVARTLVVPVRRLRRDALEVAHVKLPDELAVVRSGGATPEISPVGVHSTDEIGQLARAVDEIHEQALNLAGDQARLRLQIGNMFETLSRRSQSLVEQQLALIEELEHDEDNPTRLQTLFRLDHLATRMRRNGDNLLVLAGTVLRRGHLPPVPLSDMLWSAVSQVEDYQRVEIGNVPDGVVAGESAVDIEHLLAELIDNALRYSPPSTSVAVIVGRAVDSGYLIEITDRGLGMSADDLQTTNDRLASGGEVTIETARRMGLFVVGRLAKRHTITVSLRRTSGAAPQPGITASVHLPSALVAPPPPMASGPATGPNPLVSPGTNPLAPAGIGPYALTPADITGPNPIMAAGPRPLVSLDAATELDLPVSPLPALPSFASHSPLFPSADLPTTSMVLPQRVPAAVPAPLPEPVAVEPEDDAAPVGMWAEHDHDADDLPEATDPTTPATDSPFGLPQRIPASALAELAASSAPAAPPAPPEPVPSPIDVDPMPTTSTRLQPVSGPAPTPIYQRMVSEWLVEPASAPTESGNGDAASWSAPGDAGWSAAAEADHPPTSSRTSGGLPIRKPGAQLVPGGLTPAEEAGARDPEEIRNNLTRHLSGVRSGRAEIQHNDGGLE